MPNPKVSVTIIVSRDCSSARSRSECKSILESPISYNFTVRIIQLALLKPCCIGHYTIDNRYEKNFNMHSIILNVKINISPLSSSPNAIVLQHAFLNQKSPNSKKKQLLIQTNYSIWTILLQNDSILFQSILVTSIC